MKMKRPESVCAAMGRLCAPDQVRLPFVPSVNRVLEAFDQFNRYSGADMIIHNVLVYWQFSLFALGIARNVIVAGANVTVPEAAARADNSGIASFPPSFSSLPFSCTVVSCRFCADNVYRSDGVTYVARLWSQFAWQ